MNEPLQLLVRVRVRVRVGVGVGDEVRVSFSLGVCHFEIVLAQISVHKRLFIAEWPTHMLNIDCVSS